MLKRGVALFVSCAVSSVAFGGAAIELVPNPNGCVSPGDQISVAVMLSQDPSPDPIALRMIQFDLAASDEALSFPSSPLHCGNVRFWDFSSTGAGQGNPADCGTNHYIDAFRNDSRPCCPNILAIAYGSDTALGQDLNEQLILPANGSAVQVATLAVSIPLGTPDGSYMLDVVNAGEGDPDLGAQLRWGFGTNIDSNPLTNWRAGADLTGGTLKVEVKAVCEECFTAVADKPGCDGVIPRRSGAVMKLQYSGTPPASSASFQVRELLADGAFGPNLNNANQFEMVNLGDNIIKLTDTGANLENRTWYGVTDECGTQVDYIVMVGNVDGDGDTDALDANAIWQNRLNPVSDNTPLDIDGDGDVDALDVNAAWQNRDALVPPVPAKPTGHVCPD